MLIYATSFDTFLAIAYTIGTSIIARVIAKSHEIIRIPEIFLSSHFLDINNTYLLYKFYREFFGFIDKLRLHWFLLTVFYMVLSYYSFVLD